MTRFLLSSVAAAVLLAAPVAASAATKAAAKPVATHTHKHMSAKHATPAHATTRTSGDAAVDQLNQQSLDRARAGNSTTAPAAPAQ